MPTQPTRALADWRALASDDITARKFWEGVLNEVTLILEASEKDGLSSREIFDALPFAVSARFADFKGGENKAWTGKLKAWAQGSTRIRMLDDGRFVLSRSD